MEKEKSSHSRSSSRDELRGKKPGRSQEARDGRGYDSRMRGSSRDELRGRNPGGTLAMKEEIFSHSRSSSRDELRGKKPRRSQEARDGRGCDSRMRGSSRDELGKEPAREARGPTCPKWIYCQNPFHLAEITETGYPIWQHSFLSTIGLYSVERVISLSYSCYQ